MEKSLTWEKIATDLSMSPVWLTSACLGMNSAPEEKAIAITNYLGLGEEVTAALMEFPTKIWDQTVPTDPLVYRLYEVVGVYGDTLKEVIQEKFGDNFKAACGVLELRFSWFMRLTPSRSVRIQADYNILCLFYDC